MEWKHGLSIHPEKYKNVREINAATCRVGVCLVAVARVGQTLIQIEVRVHVAFMPLKMCEAFTYQQLVEED